MRDLLLGMVACVSSHAAVGASAQERDERPPVFFTTATVTARRVSSSPGSLTVIDREQIEAQGATHVGELLLDVPGFTLQSAGTRGGLAVGQLRGGDPNFTLVLLDGVPLNDATDPLGGTFNLESLPTAGVERIEVMPGTLSNVYGSTGLAGVVNVFTRRGRRGPKGDSPSVEAGLETGNASWRHAEASVFGGTEKSDSFLGASWEQERSRVADESFEQADLRTSLGRALGQRGDLRLTARGSWWETDDYPEASGGPVFGSGPTRHTENREWSVALRLVVGDSDAGGAGQTGRVAFKRHTLDRISPGVFPQVPVAVESTGYDRARGGWTLAFRPGARTTLGLGLEVERERGDNVSTLLLPASLGGAVAGDYAVNRTWGGVFAEVVHESGPWVVEAGGRLDTGAGIGLEVSPRAGVSWRVGRKTRLRTAGGRAFKLPSFFALASPAALGGNAHLRPETSLGAELGLEHEFGRPGSRLRLTGFLQRYGDLVDFDFETFRHVNQAEVRARGVEAGADWNLGSVRLAASVAWQQVEDQATSRPLLHRPRWAGAVRLRWEPTSGLSAHLRVRGVTSSLDRQIPVPERDSVAGHVRADLALGWQVADRWQLRAKLDNLTDEHYETLIGFPAAGLAARVGVHYRPTRRGPGPVAR